MVRTLLSKSGVDFSEHAAWLNMRCPFCDDSGKHLGYNVEGKYFNCFKCGWHELYDALQLLTGLPYQEIQNALAKNWRRGKKEQTPIPSATYCALPEGRPIEDVPIAVNYLQKRRFTPSRLEMIFRVYAMEHIGQYSFRLIIPILYHAKVVSFTSRDYTGKQSMRYMTCPREEEVIHHKHILYNLDGCKNQWCVVVEGPTDVWRLGYNSCATFGTQWTHEQAVLLASRFKHVFVMYDREPHAQHMAERLAAAVSSLGARATVVSEMLEGYYGDPGALLLEEAAAVMRQIEKMAKT